MRLLGQRLMLTLNFDEYWCANFNFTPVMHDSNCIPTALCTLTKRMFAT